MRRSLGLLRRERRKSFGVTALPAAAVLTAVPGWSESSSEIEVRLE